MAHPIKTVAIRTPRHRNEILIERGCWPARERQYATVDKAAELQRAGWVVFYAAGTGWAQRSENTWHPFERGEQHRRHC